MLFSFCIQRLPKKFVKKYGNELSAVATLSLKDGRVWFVRLQKADLKLWFCDGWHEFLEDNSITSGHFLIFRYEGNSSFSVYIYRLSQCDIESPGIVVENDNQKNLLVSSEELNPEKQYSLACMDHPNNTISVSCFHQSSPSLSPVCLELLEGSCSMMDLKLPHGCIITSREVDANPVQQNLQLTQNFGTQTGRSEPEETHKRLQLMPDESMQTRRKRRQTSELS